MDRDGESSGLKRTLGLPGLLFYAVGLIVGAGVYSVIGAAALEAGDALWQSLALGALAAVLTGLAYAELATAFPRAGAESVYLAEAFPRARWVGELVGAVLLLAAAGTATTVALAFGGYLRVFVDVPAWITAVVLLVAATSLNLVGMRQSTWLNATFTLIEVAGLCLFVGLATTQREFGAALTTAPHMGVLGGTAVVFFAYLGFEDLANLAEEAKDPGRDLPRAILLGVAITGVLYVLVGLAAVAVATPEELSASESPLSDSIRGISPVSATVLAVVALFSTANTALIALVASSRMLYGMARDGAMPKMFAVVSGRSTPWRAAIALLGVALALLPLGGVSAVAGLSSFAALLGFAAVDLSVVVLRKTQPDRKRPFRVPLAVWGVPVLPVLGAIAALALATQFDSTVYIAGAVSIGVAAAVVGGRRMMGNA